MKRTLLCKNCGSLIVRSPDQSQTYVHANGHMLCRSLSWEDAVLFAYGKRTPTEAFPTKAVQPEPGQRVNGNMTVVACKVGTPEQVGDFEPTYLVFSVTETKPNYRVEEVSAYDYRTILVETYDDVLDAVTSYDEWSSI